MLVISNRQMDALSAALRAKFIESILARLILLSMYKEGECELVKHPHAFLRERVKVLIEVAGDQGFHSHIDVSAYVTLYAMWGPELSGLAAGAWISAILASRDLPSAHRMQAAAMLLSAFEREVCFPSLAS